jgi:hypothetical protein
MGLSMRSTVIALAAGAGLTLVACSMTWVQIQVPLLDGVEGAMQTITETGRELAPAANAAGWAALAGVLAVIATKSWGRTIIGLIVTMAGLVTVIASVSARPGSSLWWLAAATGGILVMASGISIAINGRGWPGLSRRYEAAGPAGASPRKPLTPWEAMDRGQDPTAPGGSS